MPSASASSQNLAAGRAVRIAKIEAKREEIEKKIAYINDLSDSESDSESDSDSDYEDELVIRRRKRPEKAKVAAPAPIERKITEPEPEKPRKNLQQSQNEKLMERLIAQNERMEKQLEKLYSQQTPKQPTQPTQPTQPMPKPVQSVQPNNIYVSYDGLKPQKIRTEKVQMLCRFD